MLRYLRLNTIALSAKLMTVFLLISNATPMSGAVRATIVENFYRILSSHANFKSSHIPVANKMA